jgi:hypothetical protein
MTRTLMAQPVYPQLRKYPCVPALTLRPILAVGQERFAKESVTSANRLPK